MSNITRDDLKLLSQWDTPTICNGLELISPDSRSAGFTTQNMICSDPKLPPIVGFARTATIRSSRPSTLSVDAEKTLNRVYYAHIAETPQPTITIIQDLDSPAGFGAWWGEVHTTIHKAFGCLGTVTNGSIRDLNECASGFQMLAGSVGPSHAHVHTVEVGCEVRIFSMTVRPGDIIHADQHGAVVVPIGSVKKLPQAIDLIMRREKTVLDAARSSDFDVDKLMNTIALTSKIH